MMRRVAVLVRMHDKYLGHSLIMYNAPCRWIMPCKKNSCNSKNVRSMQLLSDFFFWLCNSLWSDRSILKAKKEKKNLAILSQYRIIYHAVHNAKCQLQTFLLNVKSMWLCFEYTYCYDRCTRKGVHLEFGYILCIKLI